MPWAAGGARALTPRRDHNDAQLILSLLMDAGFTMADCVDRHRIPGLVPERALGRLWRGIDDRNGARWRRILATGSKLATRVQVMRHMFLLERDG